MKTRRILSLWFPRFGAERLMRRDPLLTEQPLGVVEERHNSQVLSSLNAVAAGFGLRPFLAASPCRLGGFRR